ncbi:SusC/RagA family TonB-linked outer membrane protein [Chitinophaga rhizophila]|uniref:SusC/RagA family TonB-linked outer membrane protein n=1 Tax=Chitinophaga rhizophila TaxID=2866212 RepID=A0ABS7G755_9BACT|nr:SusC/RagA family TonB-linked outer membrane protein [Chitinophaga rhizophila]MBW8683487.1 SusC/RagA family TonB-linked outer membrane protein [Chitinophaga rhizophila]
MIVQLLRGIIFIQTNQTLMLNCRVCQLRLRAALLLFALTIISQVSLAQGRPADRKVTLHLKNVTLKEIFQKITQQTGLYFNGSDDDLDRNSKQTIDVDNEPVNTVLAKILGGKGVSWLIEDKSIVISRSKDSSDKKSTQTSSPSTPAITGIVKARNGSPLPGASIAIKNGKKSAIADTDGKFILEGVSTPTVLVITNVGFDRVEMPVLDNRTIEISLNEQVNELTAAEVVSTGYQFVPKERSTGSFAQVNNELFNKRVSPDVLSRLEGNVPGLLFNKTTAGSTTGSDISIRGHSTLFANDQPLIVLDNFPYDGNINNINPNDIQSITVLKDAAASSIWGVRSGNGVIVITTKKGRQNLPLSVEVNANVTTGNKPNLYYDPRFLASTEFIPVEKQLFNLGYYDSQIGDPVQVLSPVVSLLNQARNGEITMTQADAQINALTGIDLRGDISKYLYRKSTTQQYAINLRGGSQNADYYLSLGYDRDLLNKVGNDRNRITINSTLNFYPVKNLQFSLGVISTFAKENINNTAAELNAGVGKPLYPYAQLSGADGAHLAVARDYASSFTDNPGPGLLDWKYRPLDELNFADNSVNVTDTRVSAAFKYTFFPCLNLEAKYQFQKSSSITENYYSKQTYYARDLYNQYTDAANDIHPVPLGGILQSNNQYINSHRGRIQLNYNQTVGKGVFAALAGAEINAATTKSNANTSYGYDKESETFSNVDFVNFYLRTPYGYASQIPNNISFGRLNDRYLSYFANGSYTYDSKYTISGSARIDKSNIFGVRTNEKSVPLYSGGLSWQFSNESFYHFSAIPYGKLRMTYGYSGNVDRSVAAVTTIQQLTNSYYTNITYAQIANAGNPRLRWERVRMINFGLDLGTRNNILNANIDFYIKKGIDLISNSPLAPSTGIPSFRGNTASTSGKGWDINLTIKPVTITNFNWTSNFLFSYALDKVTQYNETFTANTFLQYGAGDGGTIYPLIGKPLFAIYSYQSAGLNPQNGNPRGYVKGSPSEDYNAILTSTNIDSVQFHGSARPTTFGSFRNTFAYKSWSLSINIIYKLNYYFRRSSVSYTDLLNWKGHKDFVNRWQKPGDENFTDVPSLVLPPDLDPNRDNFYLLTDKLVEKGDHIRLQDINLTYTFTKSQLPKLPFKSLQLYACANNVGIIWKANKQGLDPDTYAGGLPLPRTYSFGVRANF